MLRGSSQTHGQARHSGPSVDQNLMPIRRLMRPKCRVSGFVREGLIVARDEADGALLHFKPRNMRSFVRQSAPVPQDLPSAVTGPE